MRMCQWDSGHDDFGLGREEEEAQEEASVYSGNYYWE